MERYSNLGIVGEGSYGVVSKCVHKDTGLLVAIKEFIDLELDPMVKKIALREVKMLRLLQHENLINLLEVFYEKKGLHLVFEFMEYTLLDEVEKRRGLDENTCKKMMWQILRGTSFMHLHNVIHRDIKPENILINSHGLVKICDFGFARILATSGEVYTDYVATRWYRAPELLVGDIKYGRAVDIWALGCLMPEMLTGEALFPGDSDIDQLYLILGCCGSLTKRQKEVFMRNPLFISFHLPAVIERQSLEARFRGLTVSAATIKFMTDCLTINPDQRPSCSQLQAHCLFTADGFDRAYSKELKKIALKSQGQMNKRVTVKPRMSQEASRLSKQSEIRTDKQSGRRTDKQSERRTERLQPESADTHAQRNRNTHCSVNPLVAVCQTNLAPKTTTRGTFFYSRPDHDIHHLSNRNINMTTRGPPNVTDIVSRNVDLQPNGILRCLKEATRSSLTRRISPLCASQTAHQQSWHKLEKDFDRHHSQSIVTAPKQWLKDRLSRHCLPALKRTEVSSATRGTQNHPHRHCVTSFPRIGQRMQTVLSLSQHDILPPKTKTDK